MRFSILAVLSAAVIAAAAVATYQEAFFAFGVLLVGLTAMFVSLRDRPSVQLLLVAALAIRSVAALINSYVAPLPDSQADAVVFENQAAVWATQGWSEFLSHFTLGAGTYSWILSVPYIVFGRSQLLAAAFNIVLGTLIVLNTYLLAKLYYGSRAALGAGWTAALFPALILYSALPMREVCVGYPLTLGLLYFSGWLTDRKPVKFIAGTICFVIAGTFHWAVLMCLLVFIGAIWLGQLKRTIATGRPTAIMAQLLAGAILLPIAIWGTLSFRTEYGRLIDILADLPTLLTVIENTASAHAEGRLAYLQGTVIGGPVDVLWLLPLRIIYFLFSPFPWVVTGSDAVLSLDGLFYAALIPAASIGLMRSRATVPMWPAMLAVTTLIVIFSFGTSNSGTAFRHRAKAAPMLIALGVPTLFRRKDRSTVAVINSAVIA